MSLRLLAALLVLCPSRTQGARPAVTEEMTDTRAAVIELALLETGAAHPMALVALARTAGGAP